MSSEQPFIQMPFDIRSATKEDAASICGVLRQSIVACCTVDHHDDPDIISRWLSNKTTENAEKWITAPNAIALVAQQGSQLLGVALISGDELALCYVSPSALYQGVGKALLRKAEIEALARGIEVLRLDSTKTARPFYRRNGFSTCGEPRSWAGLETQPMSKKLLPGS